MPKTIVGPIAMQTTDALTIRDYAAYLVGNRQAILRIAKSRGAVWIGALFVLSAGLAREYDGEDLRAEPWHLAIPFGASFVTSFVLFGAVWLAGRKRRAEPMPFWKSYRGFLSLYWASAPLAWLYAIPFERMLPIIAAIKANYALLLIVSIWRVLLITRAIAVVNSCRFVFVLPIVTLISSMVALAAAMTVPVPMLALMGGIRPPEDEMVTLSLTHNAGCVAFLGIPVSMVCCIAVSRRWRRWRFPRDVIAPTGVARALSAFALLTIVAWIPALPGPQLEQRNRRLVQQAVADRRHADAIQILRSHPRADFPPHWRPPPWVTRSPHEMDAVLLLEEAERQGAPVWVIEAYYDTTCRLVRAHAFRFQTERAHIDAIIQLAERDDSIVEALEPWMGPSGESSRDPAPSTVREAVIANLRLLNVTR